VPFAEGASRFAWAAKGSAGSGAFAQNGVMGKPRETTTKGGLLRSSRSDEWENENPTRILKFQFIAKQRIRSYQNFQLNKLRVQSPHEAPSSSTHNTVLDSFDKLGTNGN
jgi:hypothetical protein